MMDNKKRGSRAETERLKDKVVEAREPRQGESVVREEIARRAHEIFLARGGGEGRDVEDWLRAESEVLARRADR